MKSKTDLRMRYEAEASVIKQKIGNLNEVRQELGLSSRKMSQLLLIDPSTWTRWSKDPEKVPPHIYRSIQWYLSLIEKHPEWHPANSFMWGGNRKNFVSKEFNKELTDHKDQVLGLKHEISHLRGKYRLLGKLFILFCLVFMLTSLIFFILLQG